LIPQRRARRGTAAVLALGGLLAGAPALADTVETSGDVLRWAIPAAAGGVAWWRDDHQGLRQFGWSFAATAASTLALKAIIDKDRPDDDGDSDAFPSGHAATSFAGATFLHRRYGWRDAVPAYVLSAYVGWTRVDADEHEWEDVLGGAVLAAAWTWWLVEPRPGVEIAPTVGRDGVHLRYAVRW
jgi:membrane-associated phospholipid phosphatase